MGATVECGGRRLLVSEDEGPCSEGKIHCDDDGDPLVQIERQEENELPTVLREGRITQFIGCHQFVGSLNVSANVVMKDLAISSVHMV